MSDTAASSDENTELEIDYTGWNRPATTAAGPQPKPGAKPDELALWQALEQGEWPRNAGHRLGIPPRRVEYLCHKWGRQGIYDWGVVHDKGWINR